MPTRLYIVRHGESTWNALNKIQGSSDIELTEMGLMQARMLSKRLRTEKIDAIYSSDLKRAYLTASIIANELNLDVKKLPELREIAFGVWEGLTVNEIQNLYKDIYDLWRTNPVKAIIEGAETLKDVQNRILNGTYKLIDKYKNKNILIVSHGTSIKSLILGLLGLDLSYYPKIRQDNTALNIVDIKDDGNAVLVLLNDTCHLRSENNWKKFLLSAAAQLEWWQL